MLDLSNEDMPFIAAPIVIEFFNVASFEAFYGTVDKRVASQFLHTNESSTGRNLYGLVVASILTIFSRHIQYRHDIDHKANTLPTLADYRFPTSSQPISQQCCQNVIKIILFYKSYILFPTTKWRIRYFQAAFKTGVVLYIIALCFHTTALISIKSSWNICWQKMFIII